jgi:tetratricopeptide (TPR) repeat protein
MIVKNEAKVIRRCLDSVLPFVTHWVIVDTGSTDGTQDIVRDHMKAVPGALFERTWRDFGTNRSEAIELARARADYLLIIDADEVLVRDPSFTMPELTLDAYQLRSVMDAISYYRTQIVSTALPWRFEGVLHEYLECGCAFRQGRIDGLANHPGSDGARSADPLKYAKDAEILAAALEQQPTHARYAFYLAQSLRDAGDFDRAIASYERRAAMGGWAEEVYVSLLEAAHLGERLKRPAKEVVAAYLAAHEARPQRAESLCDLARYLRLERRFALAHLFAREASTLARPDDVLFVDESVYAWRSRDEQSVAAYYLDRHDEVVSLTSALLSDGKLPASEVERVRKNRALSVAALEKHRAR